MKEMGDKNNKSDDNEEKNDDTDGKKITPRLNQSGYHKAILSKFYKKLSKAEFQKISTTNAS